MTTYRVHRLPKTLRLALQKARDKKRLTNEQFVAEAVAKHLPQLVKDLKKIGFSSADEPTVPVRLPFDDEGETLASLREASGEVLIPATQLLAICIAQAKVPAPRQRRRSTK